MDKETKDLEDLQISRKLASVQQIKEVKQVEGSNLDICTVLGWNVITTRDEFKKDDIIFYFEIDSKLPDERWAEDQSINNYRVKTVEVLEGVISQGLIKPLTIVLNHEKLNLKVGDDATELLDVSKYLDEEEMEDVVENFSFPKFLIPITDEPRIQSEPRYLEAFKNRAYVATLKYDGTSSSYVLNPNNSDELWVCSRNTLKDPKKKDDYQKTAVKYKILEKLKKNPELALQGEIYGPGIQKNLLGMKEKTLAIFNIYNTKLKRCLDYDDLVAKCKELDLPYVKEVFRGDNFNHSQEELIEKVKGFYDDTEHNREGCVFRLAKSWDTPTLRASFKVINNQYLTGKVPKK